MLVMVLLSRSHTQVHDQRRQEDVWATGCGVNYGSDWLRASLISRVCTVYMGHLSASRPNPKTKKSIRTCGCFYSAWRPFHRTYNTKKSIRVLFVLQGLHLAAGENVYIVRYCFSVNALLIVLLSSAAISVQIATPEPFDRYQLLL